MGLICAQNKSHGIETVNCVFHDIDQSPNSVKKSQWSLVCTEVPCTIRIPYSDAWEDWQFERKEQDKNILCGPKTVSTSFFNGVMEKIDFYNNIII